MMDAGKDENDDDNKDVISPSESMSKKSFKEVEIKQEDAKEEEEQHQQEGESEKVKF